MKYPNKPKYNTVCFVCSKSFKVHKYRLKIAKYCSHKCFTKTKIGRKLSEKTKLKLSKYRKLHPLPQSFKKGYKPWNEGMIGYMSGKKHWNYGNKGYKSGNQHYNWKGNLVGYRTLHKWIENQLGKPDTCKHCGRTNLKGRKIHWSNISKTYKREISDWIRLCAKCHKIFDKLCS